MRILLCSHVPLLRRLGAAKVFLEIHEAYLSAGAESHVCGPAEVCPEAGDWPSIETYVRGLRSYLQHRAGEFDVVEYEHSRLPFPRAEFAPRPLLVARSVLLAHYLESIPLPRMPGIRGLVGSLINGPRRRRGERQAVAMADSTLRGADLINVCNDYDFQELCRRGYAANRILTFPFGLFAARRQAFALREPSPAARRIAFVGTFDLRKGLSEFPAIAARVVSAHPDAVFCLIGTGRMRDAQGVKAMFPRRLRDRLEVIPEFAPEELPGLLSECSVGLFPSYFEGFPFGVLEMLAAGLPVAAYDAPGAPMMVPAEWLAPRGDAHALAARLAWMLRDANQLRALQLRAREIAGRFKWDDIARETVAAYRQHLALRDQSL